MEIDVLIKRLKAVKLAGLIDVGRRKKGESEQETAVISLWRIRGILKNDKDKVIKMIVDPSGPGGDLFFMAPQLDKCEAYDKDLTIYMHANHLCVHGGHSWDPSDGEVYFSYALPNASGDSSFPDVGLLQALIKDMYESLLYPERRSLLQAIEADDLDGDEDKKKKAERVVALFRLLTNPSNERGATNSDSV